MVSQNAIPSKQSLGGTFPYVFTEHGVLMLANILKSKQAIVVSLRLVEIFVKMREILAGNKDIMLKLEQMEKRMTGSEQDIQVIFSALKKLLTPVPVNGHALGSGEVMKNNDCYLLKNPPQAKGFENLFSIQN